MPSKGARESPALQLHEGGVKLLGPLTSLLGGFPRFALLVGDPGRGSNPLREVKRSGGMVVKYVGRYAVGKARPAEADPQADLGHAEALARLRLAGLLAAPCTWRLG